MNVIKSITIVALIALSSCTLYIEEPEMIVETNPYYYPYHYVWVRDPFTGYMVRRLVP
jgi:hypothetical protein